MHLIPRMCDMEALILSVQKYPCIWDIHHDEYHNHVLKDLAWKEICKELFVDWDNVTESQRKTMSAEFKKKWTNVRDYYRKDVIKRKEAGSAAKKMKKYVYADLLAFLEPMLTKKKTEFETINCDSNSNNDDDDDDDEEQHDEEYENEEYLEEKYEAVNCDIPTKRKSRRLTLPSIPTSSRVKHKKVVTAECDDDDSLFLLSFRGDMRQMDSEQKMDFKIGLLNLVRSVMHSDDS